MARKARRAKKQHPESAAGRLDEIESIGDRVVLWVGENPIPILGTLGGILLIAGAIALGGEYRQSARSQAAASLATVQADYRRAMGASPAAVDIPEPANPETARAVREEYVEKFVALAAEYDGQTVSAFALLDAGAIQQELGEPEAAIATFGRGLQAISKNDPVRPFLHISSAAVHEEVEAWGAAAAEYRAAADDVDFPLRWEALASAGRCYAHAGDAGQALAAFEQLETEAPDYRMPPYLKATYSELRSQGAPQ